MVARTLGVGEVVGSIPTAPKFFVKETPHFGDLKPVWPAAPIGGILYVMNKKWFHIALLALMTLGATGTSLAQANCLTMMRTESCCCGPSEDGDSHCPMPAQKTDCPMFEDVERPNSAIVPAKFVPGFDIVFLGTIEVDTLKTNFSLEKYNPSLQSFRTTRQKESVPQFRAPPVTPVAA